MLYTPTARTGVDAPNIERKPRAEAIVGNAGISIEIEVRYMLAEG